MKKLLLWIAAVGCALLLGGKMFPNLDVNDIIILMIPVVGALACGVGFRTLRGMGNSSSSWNKFLRATFGLLALGIGIGAFGVMPSWECYRFILYTKNFDPGWLRSTSGAMTEFDIIDATRSRGRSRG